MRTALLFAAVVASSGCSHCEPGSCKGCCSADGECVAGTTLDQCGTGGALCSRCSSNLFAQCVTGLCLMPALISGPTEVDFGTAAVNTEASQSITLTNSGDLPLQIAEVKLSSGDVNAFAVEPVPNAPIDPKQSLVITFDFAPRGNGYFQTTASVTSNAGSRDTWLIHLSGTGI